MRVLYQEIDKCGNCPYCEYDSGENQHEYGFYCCHPKFPNKETTAGFLGGSALVVDPLCPLPIINKSVKELIDDEDSVQ